MTNEELLNKALRIAALAERINEAAFAVQSMTEAHGYCAKISWDSEGVGHVFSGKLSELTRSLLEELRGDADETEAIAEGIADELKTEAHDSLKKAFDEAFPDQGFNPALFSVIVHEHIKHAEAQHPKFADRFTGEFQRFAEDAEEMRKIILFQESEGSVSVSAILLEEVYEFLAEVAAGNLEKAKAEAGDVAAVLYRTIKMMEDKQ